MLVLCGFLSLPPTSSSYHSSSSNHLLFTAAVAVSLPSEPYGECLIWSRWMCAIQQSELQSGLKQRLLAARLALHSAVCELLNHGKVYTTSILNSPLPLTAPLSTIVSSNVNIHFKPLKHRCEKNSAISITGLETKSVQGGNLCEWKVRPAAGEAWV